MTCNIDLQKAQKAYPQKPSHKGFKSMRGKPEIYDECKTHASISITPTALRGLDKLSQQFGISRSELIERIGRELIKIQLPSCSQNKSN